MKRWNRPFGYCKELGCKDGIKRKAGGKRVSWVDRFLGRSQVRIHRRLLKNESEYYDFSLLAVIIALTGFGLIMLYSATAYSARVSEGNDMTYFSKQGAISVACLIISIIVSQLDYHLLAKVAAPLYLASLVLMGLVHTPLGIDSHGAKRWIGYGPVNFQPSEVAKIAVIVILSSCIVRMGRRIERLGGVAFLLGLGTVQAVFCWLVTNNLSTGIIIMSITAGMVFLAHPRTKVFVIAAAVISGLVGVFILVISRAPILSSNFRLRRIMVWLQPEKYADGYGYQTMQGLYAIGAGGIMGRGLGNSIQKLSSIPEAQNDMIFAIICEELGIVGAVFLLGMFAYMLYRLLFIAQNAPDYFGSLLVGGVFLHIALQVILNVAVVVNLIPNTGVTLPFISYGGTSILFLMFEMGIALSVSKQITLRHDRPAL